MSTLVNKVRAITQSTTGETSNDEVVEFLSDGVGFLISHAPKELLSPYASEASFTTSTGVAHGNNVVLGARRGNYESQEVDKSEAAWLESGSGSYMIPTDAFPKHYERGGFIYLKPNPGTTSPAYLNYIATPSITTATSDVMGNLEPIVINRASGYDFKALGGYYSSSMRTEIGLANAEVDKAVIEIGLANAEVDKVGAEIALANVELDEAAVLVDTSIDTATAAITTACGRINTATALANTEFDKCSALLDLGETDSEADVNTALAAINTELDGTQAIVTTMHTEIGDALTEIVEAITMTDSSGAFDVALIALNAAVDQFINSANDPSVFGDEDVYTSGVGLTRVKTALDAAIAYIDTDADAWQTDEDSEMIDGAVKMARSQIEIANAQIAEFNSTVQALMGEIQGYATEVKARAEFVNAKAAVWNGEFASAQAYGNEVQTKIAIAQGYANEIKARLEQAGVKREESKARIEVGMAYLQEANVAAAEVQAYVNEVNARVQQVQTQVGVAQGYLGTAEGYVKAAQGYLGTANAYQQNVAGYLQTAQSYMNNANQCYAEGEKMFNLATQEIETYIKNSSEMIAIQAGSK